MSSLDLARWQFAITTIYHFIFVPLSIGLALLTAGLQTAWVRTGQDRYLRATKFWGKLLAITFAMGVVTGVWQEFQFGMGWSAYSRFVGDIFGAPLAMEGLFAFFLESTFLGLWLFGWDKLPRKVHLATAWAFAVGTILSAYFILTANAWMQHPVGYTINEATNRAELTNYAAVLTNNTALVALAHTIGVAFLTAGAVMAGVAAWHLARKRHVDVFRPSLKVGLWSAVVAGLILSVSGHTDAQIMTEQQPMKMAAGEALWDTEEECAGFSVFAVGDVEEGRNHINIQLPCMLSFLATGSFDGTVEGINDLQAASVEEFGPGSYVPPVGLSYWSFRLMIGFGLMASAVALVLLFLTRGDRDPPRRWLWTVVTAAMVLPFLGNAMGWIFTEVARQPWTVYGVMFTEDAVSGSVPTWQFATSLALLAVLYGVMAVVWFGLMRRYATVEPASAPTEPEYDPDNPDKPLTFAY
jgi:cytochrome d ubiquinol oxidase subunit I